MIRCSAYDSISAIGEALLGKMGRLVHLLAFAQRAILGGPEGCQPLTNRRTNR